VVFTIAGIAAAVNNGICPAVFFKIRNMKGVARPYFAISCFSFALVLWCAHGFATIKSEKRLAEIAAQAEPFKRIDARLSHLQRIVDAHEPRDVAPLIAERDAILGHRNASGTAQCRAPNGPWSREHCPAALALDARIQRSEMDAARLARAIEELDALRRERAELPPVEASDTRGEWLGPFLFTVWVEIGAAIILWVLHHMPQNRPARKTSGSPFLDQLRDVIENPGAHPALTVIAPDAVHGSQRNLAAALGTSTAALTLQIQAAVAAKEIQKTATRKGTQLRIL
jgi:hypothetical protein